MDSRFHKTRLPGCQNVGELLRHTAAVSNAPSGSGVTTKTFTPGAIRTIRASADEYVRHAARKVKMLLRYYKQPCAVILYPSGLTSVIPESHQNFNHALRVPSFVGVYAPDVKAEQLAEDLRHVHDQFSAWIRKAAELRG